MNPFEFVLILMLMVFTFAIIKQRMTGHGRHRDRRQLPPEDSEETIRLRSELSELKERLKVLERITVEKENSLSRQIDELRDR
jgi:hypothetical protein